jgi:hypothetical protein
MDVSGSGDALGQRATAEREPPPRWSATIEATAETSHAAVPRPAVIRINAGRLAVAVSVVALMTMLLADPTRAPNGAVPIEEGATVVAGVATTPAAAPSPRLVVDTQPPGSGDDSPLGVSVVGPIEGVVLELTGLPAGWKLSSGRPFGADGWRLPAADLADVVIHPSQDFVGAINLAVELRLADDTLADQAAVRREWVRLDPPTKETLEPAVRPEWVRHDPPTKETLESAVRPEWVRHDPPTKETLEPADDPSIDGARIEELCRRGEELLSFGDIASARLLLERAARARNPRAVFMLGTTYDPSVLKYLGVRGVSPNVELARNWYEKAKDLGYTKVLRLLGSLAPSDDKTGANAPPRD